MQAPEKVYVESETVACDGGDGPLGHPRVYLNMEGKGVWFDRLAVAFSREGSTGTTELSDTVIGRAHPRGPVRH